MARPCCESLRSGNRDAVTDDTEVVQLPRLSAFVLGTGAGSAQDLMPSPPRKSQSCGSDWHVCSFEGPLTGTHASRGFIRSSAPPQLPRKLASGCKSVAQVLDKSFERGRTAWPSLLSSIPGCAVGSGQLRLRGQPLDVNTVLAFELFSCPTRGSLDRFTARSLRSALSSDGRGRHRLRAGGVRCAVIPRARRRSN